jgi:putative ABC transport system permease protein
MQNKTDKISHIKANLLLYMSFRDLWFKKFRSILTILGVVIGIGSVFFLLSFGLGLQQLVQSQIIGNKSINTIDVSSANSRIIKLTENSIADFREISNVKDVAGLYSFAGKISIKGAEADGVVYGADKLYLDLSDLGVVAGKMIDPSKDNQLIINSSLLDAVGISDRKSAVGQKVTVKVPLETKDLTKTFTITGVIDSGSGTELFISKNIFKDAGVNEYSQAKVVAYDRSQVPDIRQKIESRGYQTTSPIDTLEQINQVFRFFNLILIGFGSIGMIIAVLGMLNTLTVSLLERTQEIALLIALGGRPKDMQKLFISEAIILSLIGGIVGMILSRFIGMAVDLVLNKLASGRGVTDSFTVFSVPFWLVFATVAFMVAVGYIVAFVPARRAAKINPIDALRHE